MPLACLYPPENKKNDIFGGGGIKRDQWHEMGECNVDTQMRSVHIKKL